VAEEAAVSNNIKQEAAAAAQPTPDYAANLSSTLAPTAAPPPAYVPPTPAAPNPAPVYAPAPPTVQGPPLATAQTALPGSTLTVQLPTTPLPQTSTVTRLVQLPTQPLPQGQARLLSSQGLLSAMAPRPVTAHGQHVLQLQQPGAVTVRQPFVAQGPPILRQPAVQTITTPVAAQTGQRRNLSLTKDQMLEAQEMFRTANKVTRPEKALILGFMAGSRDNPCPHLGNIVTIKLSENQENVPQTDNTYLTMIVETHFQMNYNTGEWKRIKKYRRLEDVLQQQQ